MVYDSSSCQDCKSSSESCSCSHDEKSCERSLDSSCSTTCESSCDTSCSTTCESSCDTSCSTTCESSCDTTCDTSCDTSCDTTCDTTCDSCSCGKDSCECPDGSVPVDGPTKCGCKYLVGAILVNDQEEEIMRILEECNCVKTGCIRYLCIDSPSDSPHGECNPTLLELLHLMDNMVRTLKDECFNPIVLPNNYEMLEPYLNGCQSTTADPKPTFPPISIRFPNCLFLVYNVEDDKYVDRQLLIEKYPNVANLYCPLQ